MLKPWDVYTWSFPDAGAHPAVIVGTDERLRLKDRVNVLLCSSQRSRRPPEAHEILLNSADGLDWETLCTCDLRYAVDKRQLTQRRGSVSAARHRAIGERLIRALGLAGIEAQANHPPLRTGRATSGMDHAGFCLHLPTPAA